tara:strand:+ start:4877 stop:6133 length:1257 start_codon:yes stop_codon:yes gene_type:complete
MRPFAKRAFAVLQGVVPSNFGRKTVATLLKALDTVGGIAITTKLGARLVGLLAPRSRPVLCSGCFTDHGLRVDAERIGIPHALPCPNCGTDGTKKLTPYLLKVLAAQFFVRGSVHRSTYGSAPLVQFNELRFGDGDYEGSKWLNNDVTLISEKAQIGLFHYGPRMWLLGNIEPLEALQAPARRPPVIDRIVTEYPERTLPKGESIYRLRINPEAPVASDEYDSPPDEHLGKGRLDSLSHPVLYCSQDIESCVHECRVTVEDDLYLAVLRPTRDLRLLDLTALLVETDVTEFESLDLAVHMLFFAADHSYEITREIAVAANKAGFDGILYPSYFSQVRSGAIPFETVYGLSIRRFPNASQDATSGIFSNVALFGRPVKAGSLEVACVDRLIIHKVHYDFRFGPARDKFTYESDKLADKN